MEIAVLVKDAGLAWNTDGAASMGAALAFYTIFSIAPLLIITMAIAGFFFGAEAAQGQIYAQARACWEMMEHQPWRVSSEVRASPPTGSPLHLSALFS